jgi:hypothetical protein
MMYNEEITEYVAKLKAASDAFLASCGQKDLEIYRIENFTPTPIGEEHFGQFYDGDSYVCIAKGRKQYDIHYWEGVDSTADETGCAAAFTDQLTGILKMRSVHHLELMNEESELFMSRFHGGIKYLKGGVGSGFKHYVPEEHVPELLRVFGKRYPRIFPVPVEAKQLCESDCYILDLGTHIYNWYGSACNNMEKNAALNYSVDLKNHMRKMSAKLHFPQTEGDAVEAEFWKALGGSAADVQPPNANEHDPEANEETMTKYRFWHIYEEAGKLEGKEVEERPLKWSMLDKNDTFILELYNKVYVWQGKDASTNEKHGCMKIATNKKKEWNKPQGTSITRVAQGVEDSLFLSYFEGAWGQGGTEAGQDKDLDLSV